jgi:hypothetical protein
MLMSSLSWARSAGEALAIPHGAATNGLCESQAPRTLLVSLKPSEIGENGWVRVP